jgi:hypothetical protein
MRALVAATSRQGMFRLNRGNANALARRLHDALAHDPVLALHAAYAYHDLQRDDLRDLLVDMRYTVDTVLFDVALLAGSSGPQPVPIMPVVPMLARGWWEEDLDATHRTIRARVEHVLSRTKNFKILRDYRRVGSTLADTASGIAHLHNILLTG